MTNTITGDPMSEPTQTEQRVDRDCVFVTPLDDAVSGLRRKLARTDRQKAEDAAERERAGVASTWELLFGTGEAK
jgi:hypothetical protein